LLRDDPSFKKVGEED
jgi:hypothetical protein